MARLLLLRHAESTWNVEGRWQGRGDPPLSEAGRREAARAGPALAGLIDAVVSSPLRRALETAELLAGGAGIREVEVDEDLGEVDVGAWMGLTSEEIEGRTPGLLAAWRAGRLERPPGGESREEVLERVLAALARAPLRGGRVLLVTHGGVIGAVERSVGCYAGSPVPLLGGRWFSWEGALAPDPGRVVLDRRETAPDTL